MREVFQHKCHLGVIDVGSPLGHSVCTVRWWTKVFEMRTALSWIFSPSIEGSRSVLSFKQHLHPF